MAQHQRAQHFRSGVAVHALVLVESHQGPPSRATSLFAVRSDTLDTDNQGCDTSYLHKRLDLLALAVSSARVLEDRTYFD